MKISTKGHYAVQAMVDLATQRDNFPVSLASISLRQDISLSYLEQLFFKLRKAKLVKSVRGPGGGYLLAKSFSDVTVGEIFSAVDENIMLTDCVEDTEVCSKTQKCVTQLLWRKVSESLQKTLFSVTLNEVCGEAHLLEKSTADGAMYYI